jgi:hypothetical protein
MGTLINPLSRILGHRRQIFWANNYAFNYCHVVYRQKIFQIKIFKRLFRYLLRYITKFFNIPRLYYSLSLNFIGQANNILDIKLYINNLSGYNIATLLLAFNSIDLPQVRPLFRGYRRKIKTRIQRLISLNEVRYSKTFLKWRSLLLNLFLEKLNKQKRTVRQSAVLYKAKHLRTLRTRKLKKLKSYSLFFKFTKSNKKHFKDNFNLKFYKTYFIYKFRFMRANIRLLNMLNTKFLMELISFVFNSMIGNIARRFKITKIKLIFKKKKLQPATLVRSLNNFCYLALRRGYRINYVIKVVRITVRFLKRVRGFKMIVSGRFYRRGRAMFRVSQWGEVGSQTGKNFLVYRNSQRIKEYGMCSVKLMFFFRRPFKHFSKIPLRNKWFNYLKYLRSNYKIRQHFGYIRY